MRDYNSIYKCLDVLEAELKSTNNITTDVEIGPLQDKEVSIIDVPFDIIKKTAKDINNGINFHTYDSQFWQDVTLFSMEHIKTLLNALDLDKVKAVKDVIVSCIQEYYLGNSQIWTTLSSDYYANSVDLPPANQWDYEGELEYVCRIIISRKEKAIEFEKKKPPQSDDNDLVHKIEEYKREIARLTCENERLQAEKNNIQIDSIETENAKEEYVSVGLTARKCVALCKEFKLTSKTITQGKINALLACLTNKSPTSFNNYWSDMSKAQEKAEQYAKEMRNKHLCTKK